MKIKSTILFGLIYILTILSAFAGNKIEIDYKSQNNYGNIFIKINGEKYPMADSLVSKGFKRYLANSDTLAFSIVDNNIESAAYSVNQSGLYRIENGSISRTSTIVSDDNKFIALFLQSSSYPVVTYNGNGRGNENITMRDSKSRSGYKYALLPATEQAYVSINTTGFNGNISEPGIYTISGNTITKDVANDKFLKNGNTVRDIIDNNSGPVLEMYTDSGTIIKPLTVNGSGYSVYLTPEESSFYYSIVSKEIPGNTVYIYNNGSYVSTGKFYKKDTQRNVWRSESLKLNQGNNSFIFSNTDIPVHTDPSFTGSFTLPDKVEKINVSGWADCLDYISESSTGLDYEYMNSQYNMGIVIQTNQPTNFKIEFKNGLGPEYLYEQKGILVGNYDGKYIYVINTAGVNYETTTVINGTPTTTTKVPHTEFVLYADDAPVRKMCYDIVKLVKNRMRFSLAEGFGDIYGDISSHKYLGKTENGLKEVFSANGMKYEFMKYEFATNEMYSFVGSYLDYDLTMPKETPSSGGLPLFNRTGEANMTPVTGSIYAPNVSSVYHFKEDRDDYVDLRTGKVEYTSEDLVIPGKAGHDFVLKTSYQYDDAAGTGKWMFNIPMIEVKDLSVTEEGVTYYFYQYTLNMGDGRKYDISRSDYRTYGDSIPNRMQIALKEYKFNDYSLFYEPAKGFVLYNKDGSYYSFAKPSATTIMAYEYGDRFGNKISFESTSHTVINSNRKNCGALPYLKRITDSYGNIVNVDYTGIGPQGYDAWIWHWRKTLLFSFWGNDIYIYWPVLEDVPQIADNAMPITTTMTVSTPKRVIEYAVTNATESSSNIKNIAVKIGSKTVKDPTDNNKILEQETYGYNSSGNIVSITDEKGNLREYGYSGSNVQNYTLKGYTLTGTAAPDANGRVTLDSKSYFYENSYLSADNNKTSNSYRYKTIVTNLVNKEEYSYSVAHVVSKKTIQSLTGATLKTIETQYEDALPNTYKYRNITNITENNYTGSICADVSKAQKYIYDSSGNLLTDENENRKISNTYGANAQLVTTETHVNNVKVNSLLNTLTPDGKNIASTIVYNLENTAGNIITNFDYYPDGRLKNTSMSGISASTSYVYDDNYEPGKRKTTITTSGIKKSDRTSPAESMVDETVYDKITGNVLAYKSGDDVREYTYDGLGRITETKTRINNSPVTYALTKAIYDIKVLIGTKPNLLTEVYIDANNDKDNPAYKTRTIYDSTGVKQAEQEFVNGIWRNTSVITYKANGLVDSIEDAYQKKTTFEYDDLGRVTRKNYPNVTLGTSASGITYDETIYVDAKNRVITKDGSGKISVANYDKFGRVIETFGINNVAAVDKEQLQTAAVLVLAPADAANIPQFNTSGSAISGTQYILQTGSTYTKTLYDWSGNVINDTSNRVFMKYNSLNQLVRTVESAEEKDGVYNYVSDYNYNVFGKLTSTTQKKYKRNNGQINLLISDADLGVKVEEKTLYNKVYDEIGRLIIDTDNFSRSDTFDYDSNNRMSLKKDRKGRYFRYSYQPNNLVKTIEVSTQSATEGYSTYKTMNYYPGGNIDYVEGVAGTAGRITYRYYNDSKLKEIEYPGSKIINYDYDEGGRKNKMQSYNASSYDNNYFFDEKGRLYNQNSSSKNTNYIYNNNDTLKKIIYHNDSSEEFVYNDLSRVSEIYLKNRDNTISTFNLGYNNDGNVVRRTETKNGVTKENLYTYDYMNRLKTVTEKENNAVETVRNYSFDVRNNISKIESIKYEAEGKEKETSVKIYSYDTENRLAGTNERVLEKTGNNIVRYKAVSSAEYQYDECGNMTTAVLTSGGAVTTTNYEYNAMNNLVKYSNGKDTYYEYYADGMRQSKKTDNDTTRYYYDSGNIIYETLNNSELAVNTFGIRGISARTTNNVTDYFLKNEHGDTVYTVNGAGILSDTFDYEEYGTEKTGAVSANPFRYSGEYCDSESGMYYLRARYYNPEIERFITEDTYEGEIANPESLNLYAYCEDNPIMNVDPSGHFVVPLLLFLATPEGMLLTAATVLAVDHGIKETQKAIQAANKRTEVSSTPPIDPNDFDNDDKSNNEEKQKNNTGRNVNKLKPDKNAEGEHSTFKRNSKTGEIRNYETYKKSNPKNLKNKYELEKRYDAEGEAHFNKVTKKNVSTPHVHDKKAPGGVRKPTKKEIPKKSRR